MDRLLEDTLAPHIRRALVSDLNNNNRWRIIVDRLKTYRIPVSLNINKAKDLEKKGISPAEWLLEELFARDCSFDLFCSMLRDFDLLEELALLAPVEPMVIEVQPGEGEEVIRVESGDVLHLSCVASGLPRPTYQWYHHNNALLGQINCTLNISPFREENIGVYWCLLRQEIRGHVSETHTSEVAVDLMAVRPRLLVDLPRVRSVPSRQALVLTVQAEGYPPPHYEWFRSSDEDTKMPNIVLDESSNLLEVKNAGPSDEGLYCCRVYNDSGETFSSVCKLSVFERPPDDYIASAKVALLIGNQDYEDVELQGLHAPSNDVAVLARILARLGFHVIALHNLTRIEMYNSFRWFCSILPENAYAFFYFAGHGFSKLASKFMMPIDCPKDEIQLYDCLCDEHLTQILAQGRQLQLLVMLFDCCLVESRDLSIGRTEFEHDLGNCNIVLGTATRNHQNAYESDEDVNGLFVNHLKDHLEETLPIIEVLRANQRDFREKQQQPTIFFSGADNCSLTDPVISNHHLEEKLRLEVEFDIEKKIHFKRINESFTIHLSKHKNCFLNSIDLKFPEDFSYNFSVEINSQDVKLSVDHKVVAIHNLQRVKSCLYVTVFINGLRREEGGFVSGPHDSCEFTLDCPIIQRQLWHNTGTSNPTFNP